MSCNKCKYFAKKLCFNFWLLVNCHRFWRWRKKYLIQRCQIFMCRSEIYIIIDINCLIWAHSSHQCCGSFVIVTLLSPSKFFLYDDKNQNVSFTRERVEERDRGMNQFNFGKESMSIFILQSYSRVLLFFSRPFAPLSRMLSLLLGAIVTYAIAIFSTISICMLKFSLLSHYMLCLLLSVMVLLAKRRHHFFCSSLEHRAM